jgi:hypothetical protein
MPATACLAASAVSLPAAARPPARLCAAPLCARASTRARRCRPPSPRSLRLRPPAVTRARAVTLPAQQVSSVPSSTSSNDVATSACGCSSWSLGTWWASLFGFGTDPLTPRPKDPLLLHPALASAAPRLLGRRCGETGAVWGGWQQIRGKKSAGSACADALRTRWLRQRHPRCARRRTRRPARASCTTCTGASALRAHAHPRWLTALPPLSRLQEPGRGSLSSAPQQRRGRSPRVSALHHQHERLPAPPVHV